MRNLADRRKNIIKIMNVVVPLACSFCQCPVFRYRCKPTGNPQNRSGNRPRLCGAFFIPGISFVVPVVGSERFCADNHHIFMKKMSVQAGRIDGPAGWRGFLF